MLLLLGLTYEWGGATAGLGTSEGRRVSQFTRPVSRMVLRGARNEISRQLTLLVHYVVENFLQECDLWLLRSPSDYLGASLSASLQQLGRPLRLVGPYVSERGLELPEATQTRGRACSAYIIFASSAESLLSLVESSGFQSQLHYLGRFIFVTRDGAGAARLILGNPVMAWRPHALLIKEYQGVGVSLFKLITDDVKCQTLISCR
ncbi:uncharacterized protein LOC126995483 [Eriocheir sinensis]|uniref:uncharacterized protein LOC126995483 n=1 Tax=Eriocheir sinensis TaxID=95602 RepID=UPI0021CA56CE|nr:uncharacterized protein LOC126995483 [Eriocheir sinensis]